MIFKIEGKIKSKDRPRTNFYSKSIYTPKATTDYEKKIRKEIKGTRLDGAISIELECHFCLPKNISKKKRAELLGKPCLKRPDLDNIEKIYLDAFNKVLYDDDKQVYKMSATKVWDDEEFVICKIGGKNNE